jgi:hypothetical protein
VAGAGRQRDRIDRHGTPAARRSVTTTKDPAMSNELPAIDPTTLTTVTGGRHHGDKLLSEIGSLASQIKDITAKTSGMSSTQMLLLAAVFMQRRSAPNVVYVGRNYR